MDRWTVDLQQNVGQHDRLHVFYGDQPISSIEPGWQGTTIPGFGLRSRNQRSALTINETHIFGAALLNDARFGRSTLVTTNTPS
jgi:hypothetical protein